MIIFHDALPNRIEPKAFVVPLALFVARKTSAILSIFIFYLYPFGKRQ